MYFKLEIRVVCREFLACKSALGLPKRYFIIDQQIVQHFVQYSECLTNPLPFYTT